MAKAPLDRVIAFARDHGWRHLRLLSAADNSFKRDYHGEDADGQQVPMLTVFHRGGDRIRMSWASEMFFAPTDPGQDPRHNGTLEPLWTLFDLARAVVRTSRAVRLSARSRVVGGLREIPP